MGPLVSTGSNDSIGPFPVGPPRLSVRGLTELVAELVGVDGTDVIVLAIVTNDKAAAGGGRHVALSASRDGLPAPSGWATLTNRERAVAVLAGRALTNQQIANRLQISPHTVNFHLRQVFKKLSIDSRVSLARIAQSQPPVN